MVTRIAMTMLLAWFGSVPALAQGPLEMLWSEHKQYVLVGEIHGTQEMPMVFAALVRMLHQQNKHLVVGLEIPPAEQAAINQYLAAGDAQAAIYREKMLSGTFWHPAPGRHDGRSSQAMLQMLDSLRSMVAQSGKGITVLCFLQPGDAAMASIVLRQMAAFGDDVFISLSGNLHAMRQHALDARLPTMASFFPARQTLTIDVTALSGAAWICSSGVLCGAEEIGVSPVAAPCGSICVAKMPDNRQFDFVITLASVRASAPAIAASR